MARSSFVGRASRRGSHASAACSSIFSGASDSGDSTGVPYKAATYWGQGDFEDGIAFALVQPVNRLVEAAGWQTPPLPPTKQELDESEMFAPAPDDERPHYETVDDPDDSNNFASLFYDPPWDERAIKDRTPSPTPFNSPFTLSPYEQDQILNGMRPLQRFGPRKFADIDKRAETVEAVMSDKKMMAAVRKRSFPAYLGLPFSIFIHAGAGFHSIQNEKFHLSVCSEAARKAMKILRAGGSAVDAVETAIKYLEDHEITNAGYGSNLTIDGTVECDATIVDHFGRSGACGAVPNIKNPISLAKVILETSSKTLTLRRVPPNFLVGEGAKNFGIDHGVTTVTNEQLVSYNARDRYQKWRADLDKVTSSSEAGSVRPTSTSSHTTDTIEERRKGRGLGQEKSKVDLNTKARKGLQRDHASAVANGLWNEGQPDSPTSESRSPLNGFVNTTTLRSGRTVLSAPLSNPGKRARTSKTGHGNKTGSSPKGASDVDMMDGACNSHFDFTELTSEPTNAEKDMIVDTIGAIAIDMAGNVAAGSSSGGIGIKHMGRTGPAALVGVGTAVIPSDRQGQEFRTVATVTSGTGEHMATTMAAQKCADRLYQSTRRGEGGIDQKEENVSTILQSFVQNDFMNHPGVKNQASTSAIGVMAVEVTAHGIYVHWAHNTESFALASMSMNDQEPLTVMSRLPESNSSVNIGGRKIQIMEPEEEVDGDCGW